MKHRIISLATAVIIVLLASMMPQVARSQTKPPGGESTPSVSPIQQRIEQLQKQYKVNDSLVTYYQKEIKNLQDQNLQISGYFQAIQDISNINRPQVPDTTSSVKGNETR